MGYEILILPILSAIIAQVLKMFIKSNKQKISFNTLFAYSGMPSGHSAMVVSLCTIIALEEGLASPLFSVSAVLAIITIRDALGIRKYMGENGKALNILVKDLKEDDMLDEKYPQMIEKIGHSPYQVIIGSIIGIIVSYIGYLLF